MCRDLFGCGHDIDITLWASCRYRVHIGILILHTYDTFCQIENVFMCMYMRNLILLYYTTLLNVNLVIAGFHICEKNMGYVRIYICIYMHIYVYMYVYVCIYMYMMYFLCMFTYTCEYANQMT